MEIGPVLVDLCSAEQQVQQQTYPLCGVTPRHNFSALFILKPSIHPSLKYESIRLIPLPNMAPNCHFHTQQFTHTISHIVDYLPLSITHLTFYETLLWLSLPYRPPYINMAALLSHRLLQNHHRGCTPAHF